MFTRYPLDPASGFAAISSFFFNTENYLYSSNKSETFLAGAVAGSTVLIYR